MHSAHVAFVLPDFVHAWLSIGLSVDSFRDSRS